VLSKKARTVFIVEIKMIPDLGKILTGFLEKDSLEYAGLHITILELLGFCFVLVL